MNIELVSFDVWSTLVKANQTYKQRRIELLAQACGLQDGSVVKTAMNQADDQLDAQTISTGLQFGFADRVLLTCRLLGVPQLDALALAQLETAMDDAFLNDLPTVTEPDLCRTLARLQADKDLLIAVNSNTGFVSGKLMRRMLEVIGIQRYVDYELFSDEIGAAKPSPKVFERLTELSGLRPDTILHIGDNVKTDYEGALTAGLHALHYQPNGESSSTVLVRHSDLFAHDALR